MLGIFEKLRRHELRDPIVQAEDNPHMAAELRFWDCRLDKLERTLLLLCSLLAMVLHLSPVLMSKVGLVAVLLLGVISWLTPVTGFFFIAASQYLPFPDGMPLNPAQFGVLAWCVVLVLRYRNFDIRGIKYLAILLPYTVWTSMTTGQYWRFPILMELHKVAIFAVMALQLANASKGRYLKCLFGLSLGCLLVISAYWLHAVGLPVMVNVHGSMRAGVERMGGVRSDAVALWPPILFAFAGLLGIGTATLFSPRPAKENEWLLPFCVVLSVLALPPLLSSMTTGGYVSIVMVALVYMLLFRTCFPHKGFRWRSESRLWRYIFIAMVAVVALIGTDSFELLTRMKKMWEHQKETTRLSGVAASRGEAWDTAMATIAKNPWFGADYSAYDEDIPYGYMSVGNYSAHNIFLDCGRSGGIPGMLMFAAFFFYPPLVMLRRRRRQKFFPFLVMHSAFFVFFMGLPYMLYKTVWAGWMLMALAANGDRVVRPRGVPDRVNGLSSGG